MEFLQVKFRTIDGEPDAELGGIGVFKYGNLMGVICGCCGAWHRAKNVFILDVYEEWLDFGTGLIEVHDGLWEDEDDDDVDLGLW